MENIVEIHNRVYDFLQKEHKKDPTIRFTLRVKNRADRLNQGYWFTGNDNYLAFSFWQGTDWRNKTPNIIFVITSDGKSSLEFVSYDDEKKISFFQEVAVALDMQPRKNRSGEESFFRYAKDYKGTDYIASLESFLKRDRKIIDSFIKSTGVSSVFLPIDSEEFDKAKKKINKERNAFLKNKQFKEDYEEIKSIKLDRLTINNISLFNDEQYIDFHQNLTCLIGLNGTGKTSLLRAVVLAFTGYEQNEKMGIDDTLLMTSKLQNLLRIEGEKNGKPIYATNGFTEISYTVENSVQLKDEEKYSNKVLLRAENDDVVISDDSNSDFRNVVDDKYKILFIAYPQLQTEKKTQKQIDPKYPHVSDAISMLNGLPDNRFSVFEDWLIGLNNLANDKIAKGEPKPLERTLLNDVFKLMTAITGEEVRLFDIVVTDDGKNPIWITIGDKTKPILLSLVSQGFSSVFGLIGNFMKRLVDVTPEGTDYKQTPAIVLIDEIDTYLHPQWQYRILEFLVTEFPQVQFVVTTHSPYVVGSIPNDKIKIYICEKKGIEATIKELGEEDGETETIPVYGSKIDFLNEIVFKTSSRVGKSALFISELRTAIQQNDFAKVEIIKANLENLGINIKKDTEISSLISLANTKKRIAKV